MSAPDAADRSRAPGGRLGPRPAARRPGRRPRRRRRRAARRGPAARRRLRRGATRARSPSSTAPGLVAAMHELARSRSSLGRAGSYAILNFSERHRRPRARRAAAARRRRGATAIETALLFFDLEWAALDDDARRGAARHRRARLRPPPPAHRAPLPPAPAHRARGEDPRREGAHRPHGVDAAVRGAGRRRSPSSSTDDAEPVSLEVALSRLFAPDRDVRRDAAERVTSRAPARPAHARLRVQHAARRQDGRRPAALATRTGWPAATSPTRPPTSRSQALIEAVRDALRAPAPLVPAEGAAARARQARRLRPHGRRHRRSRSTSTGPSAQADRCSTPTAPSPTSSARSSQRFFDESWIDAPVRPNKRGGAFCAYTVPLVAPVRDAQLHATRAATC